MNQPSTEIGWIITGLDVSELTDEQCVIPNTENHPDGCDSDPLEIETHPNDTGRVFVSWCSPDHGWDDLDEPDKLAVFVEQHLSNLIGTPLPRQYMTWGIIQTER